MAPSLGAAPRRTPARRADPGRLRRRRRRTASSSRSRRARRGSPPRPRPTSPPASCSASITWRSRVVSPPSPGRSPPGGRCSSQAIAGGDVALLVEGLVPRGVAAVLGRPGAPRDHLDRHQAGVGRLDRLDQRGVVLGVPRAPGRACGSAASGCVSKGNRRSPSVCTEGASWVWPVRPIAPWPGPPPWPGSRPSASRGLGRHAVEVGAARTRRASGRSPSSAPTVPGVVGHVCTRLSTGPLDWRGDRGAAVPAERGGVPGCLHGPAHLRGPLPRPGAGAARGGERLRPGLRGDRDPRGLTRSATTACSRRTGSARWCS